MGCKRPSGGPGNFILAFLSDEELDDDDDDELELLESLEQSELLDFDRFLMPFVDFLIWFF